MHALTHTHTHKPKDHRRKLRRSHRLFLCLSVSEAQFTMSIHSGGVGISTRICDLEARILGANEWTTQAVAQEETCGRKSTCNWNTWKVV